MMEKTSALLAESAVWDMSVEMLMMKPNLTNGSKLQMFISGKEDATTAEKEDMKR